MIRTIFWTFILLFSFSTYAECISLSDMFAICEMDKDEQNDFLNTKGYISQKKDYKAEGTTFGNDWYNKERHDYFQILWKNGKFCKVEYRLLDDEDCFNSIARFPAALRLKKHSIMISKYDTEYTNFSNGEYVLTLVRFENGTGSAAKWYYQAHLNKFDHFENDYLPWLLSNKKEYTEY